jgi:hypothetical protein
MLDKLKKYKTTGFKDYRLFSNYYDRGYLLDLGISDDLIFDIIEEEEEEIIVRNKRMHIQTKNMYIQTKNTDMKKYIGDSFYIDRSVIDSDKIDYNKKYRLLSEIRDLDNKNKKEIRDIVRLKGVLTEYAFEQILQRLYNINLNRIGNSYPIHFSNNIINILYKPDGYVYKGEQKAKVIEIKTRISKIKTKETVLEEKYELIQISLYSHIEKMDCLFIQILNNDINIIEFSYDELDEIWNDIEKKMIFIFNKYIIHEH